MRESLSMQIPERIDEWLEHVVCFVRRKRAMWKEFGKIFLCEFRYDIQQIHAGQLEAARLENFDHIRMMKLRGALPPRDLLVRICGIGLNELDRGFFIFVDAAQRREHDTVVRAAQMFYERKPPVDNLALGVAPTVRHANTPRFLDVQRT